MSAAVFLGALAACGGAATEKGVLPTGTPQGEITALESGTAGGRLLKAYPHALYQSADDGATWQAIPLPTSVQKGRLSAIAEADSGRVLYIGGPGVGVLESRDGGQSWVSRSGLLPSRDVVALAVHATHPKTLYVSVEEKGIHRSEDAGETWTRVDSGPGATIRQFLHSDMKGSMQTGWLFAATPDGVRRSMDCFCGWRSTGQLPKGEVFDVAYDPTQPERVYASTAQGLFRSANGGERWERASTEPMATALAVDAHGTLYAAGRHGAVLRSADQGGSWERLRA